MLVSELIEETRRILLTGAREERNKLTSPISPSDLTLTVTYDIGSIDRGAKLSIDLEDIYVWSKSSQTATVERGQFGSTAAAHSAGTNIYVNPKFSNFEIFSAMNDELVSLCSPINGLYAPTSYALTYNPVFEGYDFPYSIIDIIDVRYRLPGASDSYRVSSDWELVHDAGADFPSGTGLFIRDAYSNQPVIVRAKTTFPSLPSTLTADITLTHPSTILDIIAIGAAWRLTSPREVRRNFDESQGDTRRANEVPPGANLGGARELGRIRQLRISEEAARLNQLYPSRSPRYPFTVG